MGLTKLTPLFEILPHGVLEKNDKIFARFKITVSIKEMNVHDSEAASAGYTDMKPLWYDFVSKVNNTIWKFDFLDNVLTFSNDKRADGTPISYRILGLGDGETEDTSFRIGERWISKTNYVSTLDFIKDCYINISPLYDNQGALETNQNSLPLKQFQSRLRSSSIGSIGSLVADDKDVSYGDIIQQAGKYNAGYRRNMRSQSNSKTYNFFPIYASIMEEPEAAEKNFGLMREFLIDVDTLLKGGTSFDYAIKTDDSVSQGFTFKKIPSQNGNKYYNGPKKIFFTNQGDSANKDFDKVFVTLHDSYKEELEKESQEADGIYLSVIYKQNGDVIDDPFAKLDYHSSGFNMLVKTTSSAYGSLSLRSKQLHFPQKKLNGKQEIRSGRLTARSSLLTPTAQYRVNLLMAWRGDNLVLNRKPDDMQGAHTSQEQEEGKITADNDYCDEDVFVRTHLIQKKESLVPSSQFQLLNGQTYFFWCRNVSHTGFYLPCRKELIMAGLEDTLEYTLTVEDLLPTESVPLIEIFFDIDKIRKLPVASPMLYGKVNFRQQATRTVDTAQHIVLNAGKGETKEIRWIFPPQIKFENFRFLNYLTPESMTKLNEPKVQVDKYVSRCIETELRASTKMQKFYTKRSAINYLGDIRANSLLFYPADLFTAKKLNVVKKKAFAFTKNFPFYDGVLSVMLTTERTGKKTVLMMQGPGNDEVIYPELEDGIYNFFVYAVDEAFVYSPEGLPSYNKVDLRVSIVNTPLAPGENFRMDVSRILEKGHKNFWFAPLKLKKIADTWKSLKYFEEDDVLRIQHDNVRALLTKYYEAGNPVVALLEDEYPYEVFLKKQGSFAQGLQTNIYPRKIQITYSIPTAMEKKGVFFRLQLNDEDILEARWDIVSGPSLVLGQNIASGAAFEIVIEFNELLNQFELKAGTQVWPLRKYPNPELSIRDIKTPEKALQYIIEKPGLLTFKSGDDLVFITDQSDPYSRSKKIQLFGSTIFQAYYPSNSHEIDIGARGKEINLFVPNNEVPAPPLIDLDILVMHERDSYWTDSSSLNVKEYKTSSLVRITLQQDFMKEGKNRLGIVIAKYERQEDVETNKYISRIGEDITKLTDTDWEKNNLEDLLDFSGSLPHLQKYPAKESTVYYWIGQNTSIYKVLEFEPYYNVDLKKWQVILPLKFFRASETMFLKLVCLKIAPGRGMEMTRWPYPGWTATVFRDTTGTCLSAFSEPAQLPVYSKKIIALNRKHNGAAYEYTIKINSYSKFERKQYFICMPKIRPVDNALFSRIDSTPPKDPLENFYSFSWVGNPAKEQERMLRFSDTNSITIIPVKGNYLVIMEFEMHKNNNIESESGISLDKIAFEYYNPLFDKKGLRLINVSEFTL